MVCGKDNRKENKRGKGVVKGKQKKRRGAEREMERDGKDKRAELSG